MEKEIKEECTKIHQKLDDLMIMISKRFRLANKWNFFQVPL